MRVTGTPIPYDTGAVQSVVHTLGIGSVAFHVDNTILGVAAPKSPNWSCVYSVINLKCSFSPTTCVYASAAA